MEPPRDGDESESRADTSMTRVAVSSAGVPDPSGKALQRRTAQLIKVFGEKQRAAVVQLINEATDAILQSLDQNKGDVRKWFIKRIKKAPFGSRPEAPSSTGEARELAKVKVKTSQQGTLAFCGRRIPAQGGVPPYKSWSYLMRNEQANEIGGRVFYTDATGETIPASDSEDEERQLEGELEGAGRERSVWVMRRLAQEAGAGPDVVAVLAKRFGASKGAVASRLEALRDDTLPLTSTVSASDLPVPHTDFRHELDKALGSFCRCCRVYNCVTHSGPHVRPLRKRPYYADPKQGPCSDACWRSDSRYRPEAASAAVRPDVGPAGSAQPAACEGSTAAITAAAAAATGPEQERPAGSSALGRAAADADPAAHADAAAQHPLAGATRQHLAAAPARRRSQHSSSTPVDLCSDTDSDGAVQSPKAAAGEAPNTDNASNDSWSAYEVSMLSYGAEMFSGDACKIARLLASKTCIEVHTRMRELLPDLPQTLPGSSPAGHKRKPGAPQRRKNASQVVQKRHKHDSGKPWPAYSPCSCAGACDAACPCLKSKNFCEKFCGCSPAKCGIRFQGCDCKSGCRSKTCPCFAAGHECDTDLCKGCTKSLLGAAVAPGAAQCCNMRLRFRQHKRVAMGLSDVAGWGSFLLEQAYKGDLLGEYTGELVNQQEADRRGKAYDRDDNSYLFNLNEDWVIDARRRGNKLRFANHSADPNCMAKILMVDGDHRVGIYARKDIRPGTELTYDYCYSIEQAPSWARARRQSKKAAEPVAAQAQKLATG